MLRLTPLKETTSIQKVVHDDRVEMLIKQVKHKFRFADNTISQLDVRLRQLSLQNLVVLHK